MKYRLDHSTVRSRRKNVVIGAVFLAIVCAVLAVLAMHGIGIPCVTKFTIGIDCPACGITRATVALLRLDFKAAFGYNMLWPLIYGYLAWVSANATYRYIKHARFEYKPICVAMDYTLLVVAVVWGIVRNVLRVCDGEPLLDSTLIKYAIRVVQFVQQWIT